MREGASDGGNRLVHLAQAGDVKSVEEALGPWLVGGAALPAEARGLSPTVGSNLVLKACANAGDLSRAERWYGHMRSARVRVNAKTYGKLAEAAAKRGDHLRAESWLTRGGAEGFPPDAVRLCTAVDASGRAGDPVRAEAWLARAELVAGDAGAVSEGFGAALGAWARAAEPRRAELLLGRSI